MFLFLPVRVCLRGFGFALFAEFFAQLSTSVCALALNSSLMDLVHYTRQGFPAAKTSNQNTLTEAQVDSMP